MSTTYVNYLRKLLIIDLTLLVQAKLVVYKLAFEIERYHLIHLSVTDYFLETF